MGSRVLRTRSISSRVRYLVSGSSTLEMMETLEKNSEFVTALCKEWGQTSDRDIGR